MMRINRPIIKGRFYWEIILNIAVRARGSALIFFFLIFTQAAVFAQSDLTPAEPVMEEESSEDVDILYELPFGYGEIELGMELEAVQDLLMSNPNFSYRGEPDVSMLPQDKQKLIDCDGVHFVDRAFFQFEDEKLYLIIIIMDQEFIDHFSIYTSFLEKYGQPSFLNPSKANWEDEKVIISLERPLSLKYMDRQVFKQLLSDSENESTMEAVMREDFINSF